MMNLTSLNPLVDTEICMKLMDICSERLPPSATAMRKAERRKAANDYWYVQSLMAYASYGDELGPESREDEESAAYRHELLWST